ncbi:hypothetical protein Acr_01g0009670 [Actinidia rufa]|uniref:Uncharacterized protein n=1 Tax=Actinidia rufa TaxID=165716 RepID=A0A7J0E3X4_9ERIC|nr:hypothetical protein Acr_01g0009670 [Actinidia rufa]
MVLRSGVLHEARPQELEALDENDDKACSNLQVIRDELLGPTSYDNVVRPRKFQVGDLVLRAAPYIMRGISSSKLAPKWEGPFIIMETNETRYYPIDKPGSDKPMAPINAKCLKMHYP